MKCPMCQEFLFIDDWGGWIWSCFHCDYVGRQATNEEIEDYENNFDGKI